MSTDFGGGTGATYHYNTDGKALVPGSSGSSGSSFQGSGAGGGALQIHADGDFILASGALISASGGNGRFDEDSSKPGGGGSGGTVQIFADNIHNHGMIRVLGGNEGAGDGQILLASPGEIEQGVIDSGNGRVLIITPPKITENTTQFLSFDNSVKEKKNILVSTSCLLYTSPSPRDRTRSRMPSSA